MSKPTTRLVRLVGVWDTTGVVWMAGKVSPRKLTAVDRYEWFPGRFFLLHRADARIGGARARSLEVIGYEAKRREFVSRSFDDRGQNDEFVVRLVRRRYSIIGKKVRFVGTFDKNSRVLSGRWEQRSLGSR